MDENRVRSQDAERLEHADLAGGSNVGSLGGVNHEGTIRPIPSPQVVLESERVPPGAPYDAHREGARPESTPVPGVVMDDRRRSSKDVSPGPPRQPVGDRHTIQVGDRAFPRPVDLLRPVVERRIGRCPQGREQIEAEVVMAVDQTRQEPMLFEVDDAITPARLQPIRPLGNAAALDTQVALALSPVAGPVRPAKQESHRQALTAGFPGAFRARRPNNTEDPCQERSCRSSTGQPRSLRRRLNSSRSCACCSIACSPPA